MNSLIDKFFFVIFLCSAFILPAKDFRVYVFLVNVFGFLSLLKLTRRFNINRSLPIFIMIATLILLLNIRTLYFDEEVLFTNSDYLREYTEIFRFTIIFTIFLSNIKYNIELFYIFVKFMIFFSILNFIIVYLEVYDTYNQNFFYLFVRDNYQDDNHKTLAEYKRGFFPTGAHNALVSLMSFILFLRLYSMTLFSKYKISLIIVILTTAFCVFSSGSRAVIVGFLVFIAAYFSYLIVFDKAKYFKKEFLLIIIAIPIFLVYVFNDSESSFFKLKLLFNSGVDKGMNGRTYIWDNYLEFISDFPLGYIIGWGKSTFVKILEMGTFFTDNDLLSIFLLYGPVLFFIYIYVLLMYSFKSLFINRDDQIAIINAFIIISVTTLSIATVGINHIYFHIFITILYRFSLEINKKIA